MRVRSGAGTSSRAVRAVSVRGIAAALVLMSASLLSACTTMPRDRFTARQQAVATVPGVPNARVWVDASRDELRKFVKSAAPVQRPEERFEVLAISGGAWDGAYGAGIVNGWTKTGTRPQFTVVTGVSAGSLIAPFAFLGPDYDAEVRGAFAGGEASVVADLGRSHLERKELYLTRETVRALGDGAEEARAVEILGSSREPTSPYSAVHQYRREARAASDAVRRAASARTSLSWARRTSSGVAAVSSFTTESARMAS